MNWREGHIAVDWGTTNRRAYALDAQGHVSGRIDDARGLLAVGADGFDAAAREITAALGDRPMLLAGMVGSNRGWREAPYVRCPADIDALARDILWIEPRRIGIVPGICQVGDAGADVMRGEEVQALGAVAAGLVPRDATICHPGTHAKWIAMKDGRIDRFCTMMTGEVFALLRNHSILAAQLQGDVVADEAFATGVGEALGGADILSSLFGIRARFLLGGASADASYASGLLIGSDVRAGLDLAPSKTVALIGAPELSALYAAAIEQAGGAASIVSAKAAFLAGIRAITEQL